MAVTQLQFLSRSDSHSNISQTEQVKKLNFSENECRGKPFAFNLVDEHGYQTTNREGLLLVHTLKSIEVNLVTKLPILGSLLPMYLLIRDLRVKINC